MHAVSHSNAHSTRKLHGSNTHHGVASGDATSFSHGSKLSGDPHAPASAGESIAAARAGGSKRAGGAYRTGMKLGSDSQGLEDVPVGPGRTRAGVDFERLIEQKLQEQGGGTANTAAASQLHQCGSCGRHFTAAALERHRVVCAKVFASKRPPMDMSQQRLAGMEGVTGDFGDGDSYGRVGKFKGGRGRGVAGKGAAVRSKGAASAPTEDERPAVAGGVSRAGKWKQQSQQLRAAMNMNKYEHTLCCGDSWSCARSIL